MLLIIDSNEKSTNPKVFADIKKHFSQVIVADLPHHQYGNRTVTAGDINIPLDDGSILAIERKTPEDSLGSIASRHIFDQLETMANNAKFNAVIITGCFKYSAKTDMVVIEDKVTGWHGRDIRSVLRLIQLSGCMLIFCPPKEFCNQIEETYSTVNKPTEHRGVRKNRIVTFPPTDDRIEYLTSFPGVEITLADRLLKFAGMMDKNADEDGYGTIASALSWVTILGGIDKSSRPAGWGPAKILTVRKFLGLSSTEYLKLDNTQDTSQEE